MRPFWSILKDCECEETKGKINARAARTSPIKASRKHDSSSGRKGTNISLAPSLQELLSLLSWCHALFCQKDPSQNLLLLLSLGCYWFIAQKQEESGVTEWHPVCVVCSRKFESWCMCGFLRLPLSLRNSLSEKQPLKGSSLSSPQLTTVKGRCHSKITWGIPPKSV